MPPFELGLIATQRRTIVIPSAERDLQFRPRLSYRRRLAGSLNFASVPSSVGARPLDGAVRLRPQQGQMAQAREKVRIDLDDIEQLFGLVEISQRLEDSPRETRFSFSNKGLFGFLAERASRKLLLDRAELLVDTDFQ